ncbi:MAG: DUF2256 domain-containing protein [Solirubrobacterales bacterium]|nr:DUF2256 domain-containing protein [Solirubrobacterales bacterium]
MTSRAAAGDRSATGGGLPTKTCAACGRPFAWRRKWARDWEHVRYCSQRCRRTGNAHSDARPSRPD